MEATTSNFARATTPLGPSGQSLLSWLSSSLLSQQPITTSTTIINAPSGITVSSPSSTIPSSPSELLLAAAGITPILSPAGLTPILSPAGPIAKNTVGHHIPSDILDDLASRFIINVPDDERNNLIRICFQIELAHWFYLDFFCSIEEKKLVPCGIKQFATHLFHHIPFLRTHLSGLDKILEDWKEYKLSVPTYGAILLSEDLKHVLLVQSYWAKSSWGFPKGKVNEHEDPIHCATREVFEETGYDITGLIIPNDYIEAVINYQYTRLYLVRNVPLQTLFAPRTRKEIKCCEWFPVDSLPTNKNDVISKTNLGINPNSFFMIIPFIKRLKKWVNDNRSGIELNIIGTTLSLSSVAQAGQQQQQLQNQQQQQISLLTSIATSATTLITTTTTAATAAATATTLLSKYNSNRKNDIKSINGNNALNINSNNIKNNYVIGCNGKRQRHKSMGDIDGIKINITNNSNYYNNTKTFGTKSNITTPNNANDLYNDNHSIVKRERYLKTSSRKQLFNNNINNNSNNNNINNNINNNSISSYGNNSYVNFNNFIRQQSNSLDINTNKLNITTITTATTTTTAAAAAATTTTTANNNNSNNNLNRNSQYKIANNKYNNNNNNNNKPKSISNSTKMQTTTAHNNNNNNVSTKINPNLDSWTSFTFTKNFIANVFC